MLIVPLSAYLLNVLMQASTYAIAVLGLVVVIPWIGHATWHAYRDLVEASGLPPRT